MRFVCYSFGCILIFCIGKNGSVLKRNDTGISRYRGEGVGIDRGKEVG